MARQLGVLPYEAESWSREQWDREYESGRLERYEGLDELGRYSAIAGYVRWLAASSGPVRILDVGCGTGALRERLAAGDVASFTGVDLSAPAIAEARSRHPRDSFVLGDIRDLALDPVDVVVLNEMLYYVDDLTPFLDLVAGLVAPAGTVMVSMWRHPGDRVPWRVLDRAWTLVDRVEIRNRSNAVNGRGWNVALYRPVSGA